MILYRKAQQLRIRRTSAPEPPFWPATTIAPYSPRRSAPIAIDYQSLRASGAERLEVTVSDHVRDELERTRMLTAPVLIDAAEVCEVVFRRGEEALAWCEEAGRSALYLTSTRGGMPSRAYRDTTVVIAAWPLEPALLAERFDRAHGLTWGVAIPVVYPVTTDLEPLQVAADLAREHGASFLAPLAIDVEATAKQAMVQALNLSGDDDRYAMLFHSRVEPLQLATERHIAALAHERGLADFVVPPRFEERTNWNASVLLTLVASRMMAMELDLDLAGQIARSARLIAELDKPLSRVAEAASLSIIGGLDEVSVQMLTEWMGGGAASFAEYVGEQWRLRR